jgi:hypothetical protein
MSFSIVDAHRLGVIDTLVAAQDAEAPTDEDLATVRSLFVDVLNRIAGGQGTRTGNEANPLRRGTKDVRKVMRLQWDAASAGVPHPGVLLDGQSIEA